MPKKLRINVFETQYDSFIGPLDTTWPEFVDFLQSNISEVESKDEPYLFNAATYADHSDLPTKSYITKSNGEVIIKRSGENIQSMNMLILDFDNENAKNIKDKNHFSIQQAQKRFKEYEFVLYTSFSHLKDGKHRFRIVLPLKTPVPVHSFLNQNPKKEDWFYIKNSLSDFSGFADIASFSTGQIFYFPCIRKGQKDNHQFIHNKGKWFDWKKFPRDSKPDLNEYIKGQSPKNVIQKNIIEEDQYLTTSTGQIRAGDIKGIIRDVHCPFHNDKKPSAWGQLNDSGYRHVYCFTYAEDFPIIPKKKPSKKALVQPSMSDILDIDFEQNYVQSHDRKKVTASIKKIEKTITSQSIHFKDHIIYMPEGSGKSQLALNLASRGKHVLFACKSWNQAIEQYKDFKKKGEFFEFNTRFLTSPAGAIENRFGVKAVYEPRTTLWEYPSLDKNKTIQKIKNSHPKMSTKHIELTLHFLLTNTMEYEAIRPIYQKKPVQRFPKNIQQQLNIPNDPPNTNIGSLFVTSIEQLRTLKRRKLLPPKDWYIWIDDPDFDDCHDFEPITDKAAEDIQEATRNRTPDTPTPPKITFVNERWYALRQSDLSLKNTLKNYNRVFTTTESLVLEALQRLLGSYNVNTHNHMHKLSGGSISILGTQRVYRKHDALVKLSYLKLKKSYPNTILIGDAIGSDLNHVNTKGKNSLDEDDSIIEISHPHPEITRKVCDVLGRNFKSQGNKTNQEIILDRAHQALGRNTGYRSTGKEAIVLVPRLMMNPTKKFLRYKVDVVKSIDPTLKTVKPKNGSILPSSSSQLSKDLVEHLNYPYDWLQNRKTSKSIINRSINGVVDDEKRYRFIIRLNLFFQQEGGFEFFEPKPPRLTSVQKLYWFYCEHILQTNFITPSQQKQFLKVLKHETQL